MAQHLYLTPMLGGPGAPRFPVNELAQLIGRSERADISLFEPTVSRQHATIQARGEEIHLLDLGSKHGTFVNSKRVNQATLKVGDIVVFGLSLVLRLEASDKPIPPPDSLHVQMDHRRELRDPSTTAVQLMNAPRVSRRKTKPTLSPIKKKKRGQVQQAKIYKLAGMGAHCLFALPGLQKRVQALQAMTQEMSEGAGGSPELLEAVDSLNLQFQQMIEAGATLIPQHLETIPLAEIVRQAYEVVSSEYAAQHVDFLSDIGPQFNVRVDPPRIISALAEVLRNACQFSQEGGLVEGVATYHKGDVILTISDQGIGIPESVVDRLFDPFVTCSSDLDALGLGLFEAKQIVLSLDGDLTLSSKESFGTTVRITLPGADI